MMKLLVVSTSFPIHVGSTSGVFVKRLTDELATSVSIQVVVPDGRAPTDASAAYPVHCFRYAPKSWQRLAHEAGGLPVTMKNHPAFFSLVPFFLISFFFAIWRNSAHVDAIQANWSLPGVLAGAIGRLRGLPVVTTLRGDDVANLRASRLKRFVLRLLILSNLRLVTVSSAMADDIARYGTEKKDQVCHIPNGVDEAFLKVPPLERSMNVMRLLCIGSLIKRKQVQVAIEALAKAGGKTELTIAGDGPEKSLLAQKAHHLGVLDRVRFLGEVDNAEIPALLAHHDALVLCSRSEGRPNVVIEAMASGRGVLATNLPGVAELVSHGQSGLLFEVGDVGTLAGHIRMLEKTPKIREKMGADARQAVIDAGLSWNRCAESYLGLFPTKDETRRS